MYNISSFLERFKNVLVSESFLKECVIKAVSNQTKAVLTKEQVEIKSGIAYIKTSPLVKGELFFKKDKILEEILKETGKKKVFDVR